jgi:hypothetical protein
MKVIDGVALTRQWRGAVAEDETILGFFDWVRKTHPDRIIEDPPEPPLSLWMANVEKRLTDTQNDVDTLAVRLDDLERDFVSPETVTDMIDRHSLKLEQRIRDAFVCASRSIQP